MEASEEEDEPEDLMTTTEALAEKAEDMTRLSEHLQRRRRRCIYRPRELTTTVASTRGLGENDGGVVIGQGIDDVSKGSVTTTEAVDYCQRSQVI